MARFFQVGGRSPSEKLARMLALMLVFGVVGWAFWQNNRGMLRRLNESRPVWDETGQLDKGERKFLREFVDTMEREFQIKAVVRVRKGDLDPPDAGEREFYLGLRPAEGEVDVVLPEDRAPKGLEEYLEAKHFEGLWQDGQWRRGLRSALVTVWNAYRSERGFFAAPEGVVTDETDSLTDEDKAFINRFASGLKDQFGQGCVVTVFEGPVQVPQLGSTTMFLGVSQAHREVVVRFPSIMRKALGREFQRGLMENHFTEYFESGDLPVGVREALSLIWTELGGEGL